MGVLYKGKEPTVVFDRAVLDAIMDFFDMSDKKITVFLKAEKNTFKGEDFYNITGWYIPKQNSTRYYNIIEKEDELQLLGSCGTEDDGSFYIGAMHGGADIKPEISSSDREFFEKIFNGLSEYFYCNIDKNGFMACEVISNGLIFTDVFVDITRPTCSEELKAQLEKELKFKISDTAVGTQAKRSVIIPSKLRTDKIGWRDVV